MKKMLTSLILFLSLTSAHAQTAPSKPVKLGVLNDQSGQYADAAGPASVEVARMAIADFGGNKYSVCTASKGGIAAMMRPMAAEVAKLGITVNGVSPGYIATEMLGTIDQEGLEAALKLVPMRRYGKPEEIAAAMAFLASDDAAYITGQIIRVNGGMSMGG